ncbi:hypothetical protein [Gimesia panareensis]|uniref:hypothetical protein n=1 Tax=Gimesia panareensis TaxID=2527978 RepID=UPI00118C4446|nr:hypothetical protein [Gimesia panareensis]QDU52078.1 hypothetical protein Pan110_44480 [Gimesia panareensis]
MLVKSRKLIVSLLAFVLTLLPHLSYAEEPAQENTYRPVWDSVSDLIRRREYGTAAAFLESQSDEPGLRYHSATLEADKQVITGLLALEHIVYEQAEALPAGSRIQIYGIKYEMCKYQKSQKGDELLLKSGISGREVRKPVASLPSSTWLQLVGNQLKDVSHPSLILGVFAGFDKSPDIKAARKRFNAAAAEGVDVSLWLTRLEDAQAAKRKAKVETKTNTEDTDPLVGHWRVSIGRERWGFNLKVRENGSSIITVTPIMLVKMRRHKIPLVLARTTTGKWVRKDDGTYQMTNQRGATMNFTLIGDRLLGKTAAGADVLGLRQVK